MKQENMLTLDNPIVIAVSKSAEVTPKEAIELIINEDWICLTDEEADEMVTDYILDSVWSFYPSFLSKHTGLDEGILRHCKKNVKVQMI